MVATTQDITNPSKGLKFGEVYRWLGAPRVTPRAIATGTLVDTPQVLTVGFVPGSPGLAMQRWNVDPKSLTVSPFSVFQLTADPPSAASVAIGRFGTTLRDQVAVAYAVPGQTVKVATVDFDAQGNPTQKAIYDSGQQIDNDRVWIRSGQFDWPNPFEQTALLIAPGHRNNSLRILSFYRDLRIREH